MAVRVSRARYRGEENVEIAHENRQAAPPSRWDNDRARRGRSGACLSRPAQLNIVPTFGSSITNDPNAATIEATINGAINQYRTMFSNNITVRITFQEGGGLGGSSTFLTNVSYASYRAALAAHMTTANDTTAVNSLPIQATSPVDGQTNVYLSTASARALGLIGPGGTDSTITLNTSIMNLDRTSIDPSKYDLQSVAQHEMDEALWARIRPGLSDWVPASIAAGGPVPLFGRRRSQL